MDFTNKNVIVTGGARGIGKAVAKGIVEAGGFAIIADISYELAMDTAKELGRCKAYRIDMRDNENVRSIMRQIWDDFGQIHVLVNNAGIVNTAPLEELTQEAWQEVIDVNLTGTFAATSELFPKMKRKGYGKIVNISSVAGKLGGGLLGTSAYAASKGGVISFTKAVAREGAMHGITSNCVCPSYTLTNMTEIMDESKKSSLLNSIPLRRAAEPQEIANVILFYASDLSSFCTGAIANVDGGVVMDG